MKLLFRNCWFLVHIWQRIQHDIASPKHSVDTSDTVNHVNYTVEYIVTQIRSALRMVSISQQTIIHIANATHALRIKFKRFFKPFIDNVGSEREREAAGHYLLIFRRSCRFCCFTILFTHWIFVCISVVKCQHFLRIRKMRSNVGRVPFTAPPCATARSK